MSMAVFFSIKKYPTWLNLLLFQTSENKIQVAMPTKKKVHILYKTSEKCFIIAIGT